MNLEDGVATLTDFTASIISEELNKILINSEKKFSNILLCGGGRKNKVLLKKIQEYLSSKIVLKLIDDFKIDGDFVESQAFAFLAVRSIQKLPISFPKTPGCKIPCSGGRVIQG